MHIFLFKILLILNGLGKFEWRGFEEVLCVPLDHGTYHVVIIKPDAVVGGQVEGIIQKVRRLLLSASHSILIVYPCSCYCILLEYNGCI